MSEARNQRKKHRSEEHDPINYTCGKCKRVHKFDSEKPYVCEYDIAEEVVLGERV